MLFFPIYAVLVWAPAMYWRRRWPAFVATGLGVLFLLMLSRLYVAYEYKFGPYTRIFHELLQPYTILVGAMGLYISILPRPARVHECQNCRYDLRGLDPAGLRCPECGCEWRGPGSGREPPPVELIRPPTGPPKKRRSI